MNPDLFFDARSDPFRHMVTPGGFTVPVALTNCGALGGTTERHGSRWGVNRKHGLLRREIQA
ncbi:hypothetical protein GCM10027565_16920 [Bordetella tumulicola]